MPRTVITATAAGVWANVTQTIAGPLGLAEITHAAPKQGDFLNIIEFSFRWTAPSVAGIATLRAWGNAGAPATLRELRELWERSERAREFPALAFRRGHERQR